jgi:hypothetical protein
MKVVTTDINIASLISIRQLGSALKLGLILYTDLDLGLLDLNDRITNRPRKETHKFRSILKSHTCTKWAKIYLSKPSNLTAPCVVLSVTCVMVPIILF